MIFPFVDQLLIDRMNYTSKTLKICRQLKLQHWLERDFEDNIIKRLKDCLGKKSEGVC
jgi:hypothetical protein